MTKRHVPPGVTDISSVVVLKPRGPHHCTICLGSVHAAKTISRGAWRRRLWMISRSAVLLVLSMLLSLCGGLHIGEAFFEILAHHLVHAHEGAHHLAHENVGSIHGPCHRGAAVFGR